MKSILTGWNAFERDIFPSKKSLFERLEKGQQPHTLFITCSDSRIAPNLITQTDPGELFVIRNAGNIVPPFSSQAGGEQATIEYAVAALNVQQVVICGHSGCGAMAALMNPESTRELPAVAGWLENAQATKRAMSHCPTSESLAVIEENVLVQIENLKTHPSVYAALKQQSLSIHAWVYHFEKGKLGAYAPDLGKFIPSTEITEAQLANSSSFSL